MNDDDLPLPFIQTVHDLVDAVWRRNMLSDYHNRDQKQILGDLNQAWDRIKGLQRSIDQKQEKIDKLERQIKGLRAKNWILSFLIVSALASSIVSLFKLFAGIH